MRKRWAVLILLLAAAGKPPTTPPDPVYEHLKGTWTVTLKTQHGTTCSADKVAFTDAHGDKPITAEFPLLCEGVTGISGFVRITVTNPGQHDAQAQVDAQATHNNPGKLYNETGRISWPNPDHLVITPKPNPDGTASQFDLTRAS